MTAPDLKPVAWLCEDMIFKGEHSIVTKEAHALARAAMPNDWRVTPLYTRAPLAEALAVPEVAALMLAGSKLAVAAWQNERVSEAIDEWNAALRAIWERAE